MLLALIPLVGFRCMGGGGSARVSSSSLQGQGALTKDGGGRKGKRSKRDRKDKKGVGKEEKKKLTDLDEIDLDDLTDL